MLSRRRHWARANIGTTVRVGRDRVADGGRGGSYPVGSLYVLRRNGHRMLRLTTSFWAGEELDALVAAIDAPNRVDMNDADFEDIVEHFPHAFTWARRHLASHGRH